MLVKLVSYLMKTNSFKKTVDNERYGELILKPDELFIRLKNEYLEEYKIKQYQCSTNTADKLRQALLDSEERILTLGSPTHNYPEDHITGRMSYYNLVVNSPVWNSIGFPLIKKIIAHYLGLEEGEECKVKSWGNVLRLDQKVFPHRHFGIPEDYDEIPQSVCGNVFLGAEVETSTTYILDGEKKDIPNLYGTFTLFPPNIPHAVRSYTGEGVRVSAAFDCFCITRDPNGNVTGDIWETWTHS